MQPMAQPRTVKSGKAVPGFASSVDVEEAAFVDAAAGLIASRWKCVILFQLLSGTARFSALRRRVSGITGRTLTSQLRELEADSLVERRIYAEVPVKVEYTLTAQGRSLEPILRALESWGRSHGVSSPSAPEPDAMPAISTPAALGSEIYP